MSYTQVPNWLIDAMPRLTGAQVMVALAVARRTIGWQKESDAISLSQLQADTGLERATVHTALQWLVDVAGIITRTPAPRNGFEYSLAYREDIPTGRKTRATSSFNELVTSSKSEPDKGSSKTELVQELDRPLVQKVNTQKKGKEIATSSEVAAAAQTRKPRRTSEQAAVDRTELEQKRALAQALFELTRLGATKGTTIAVHQATTKLLTLGATPVQVLAFWDWFRQFSTAAQVAARERRPVNRPRPNQVIELWPQFLAWWEARQAAAARAAAAREAQDAAQREEEERRAHPERYAMTGLRDEFYRRRAARLTAAAD